jgi:hypothetical protein
MSADANQLVVVMNGAIESTIPIAHKMGVKVVEARLGFTATTVPAEGNGNHFGVIYAGVLFTVAEVLGGIIPLITFDTAKYFPLVKTLRSNSSRWPNPRCVRKPASTTRRSRASKLKRQSGVRPTSRWTRW